MPALKVVNHAPHQPAPAEPLPNATNLILIDNYDSFTWNVYQYLRLEGACVTVYRNDKVTLQELIAKEPTQLVVSPGPGHPDKDAGVSKDAIKHFSGRIPVLGVCMGEQCMFSVFGGTVDVTGEILHGKTSKLLHDGKGVYEGLSQGLEVTRYHSLAGTHLTLPSCLEVSSWIAAGPTGEKEVIMGVRHKRFLVEGVQFHPESILTEEGRMMLKNFLRLQGGTWEENAQLSKRSPLTTNGINGSHRTATVSQTKPRSSDKQTDILTEIFARRRETVTAQKQIPSQRPSDLQASYDLDLSPPQISFTKRIKQSPYSLALMAEIKRASPSKGDIAINACAPQQARQYALAGASVISVLTEPYYFKGSLEDLRSVRRSLEGMPNRPAVLRKEFIFDEYQILEARLAGADTVLLIVKMLEWEQLQRLYRYSTSLGMEPLVEVQNEEEMAQARNLEAQVIGVNNRNLATFDVDLETTSRLVSGKPANSLLCALSGITGRKDVAAYQENGVGAVLVGEALMRAENTATFVKDLLGGRGPPPTAHDTPEVLVKICGTRKPDMAKAAIEAGADLIGMILVEGSKRFVPEDIAIAISEVVHGTLKDRQTFSRFAKPTNTAIDFFSHTSQHHISTRHRALLVGVFQNQSLSHILEQQRLLDLDIVQLHGSEPIEWANLIPVPVIHAFKPTSPALGTRGYHAMPLLDAGSGGSGMSLHRSDVESTLSQDQELRVFLAGGLNPSNVEEKIRSLGSLGKRVVGVDVSSGVEIDGEQSVEEIKAFISAAKSIAR